MICVVYIDNIIIFLSNRVDYVYYVREVLTRLREYSLYIKLSKCEFNTIELTFLGYQISIIDISINF